MRRLMMAVAAIALIGGAAQGQGNGKGGGQGDGPGGHQAAPGGGSGKPDRAGHGQGKGNEARGNNGGGMQAAGAPREGGGAKDRGNAPRGGGNENRGAVPDRGRGHDNGNRAVIADRHHGVDVVRLANGAVAPSRGLIAGCPPGLAKKRPPCVPPGQVRTPFRGYDRPDFWGLRLADGRYWYDDGYLVQLRPDGRIGGYVPLLGGALAIGNVWPSNYQALALPAYYESYYGLGRQESYRYADNVIYQVDPQTAAITSIAALLTGDNFVVGQPAPVGYDVYNVPYDYREQYYDTPDALYRYSDGHVYQIDPTTRLIAAAIELIA